MLVRFNHVATFIVNAFVAARSDFTDVHLFGRVDELLQLRLHLCRCFACLRTRSKVVHFVRIGFQIVKLIHAVEVNVVNVFPSLVAHSLIAHLGHTRENFVREVFD